jgi:HlyD family secretion protein
LPEFEPLPAKKTRSKWWILALGAAVLSSAAAWWLLTRKEPVEYQLARVERGLIEASVSATGNCNAVVSVQVGSQVSGNIKELHADFNTKVRKGQLVALIDPEIFQARVQQARASVESAKAGVLNAQAQTQKAQADLASAQANVENLKANIAKAKVATLDASIKLGRREALFQQGIVSSDDRDTAKATHDSAVAGEEAALAIYHAGEQAVLAARAQVEVSKTQQGSAQAQVQQTTAALSQSQADLDHTRIVAPVDGTVVARRMDVGQTVAASFQAPTIFEIAQDLTKMQVDTSVDEADIGRVEAGQTATFTVDAYPGRTFRGTVAQLRKAPINVQNVITYDVVVGVDNSDLKLFPGMTASVRIMTERRENVLRVPNSALRVRLADAEGTAIPGKGGARRTPQNEAGRVYILGPDREPKQVRVRLGISNGQFTEVEGELREGDLVIAGVMQKSKPRTQAAPTGGGGRGPRF